MVIFSKKSSLILIGITVVLCIAFYLVMSKIIYGTGFPLDDAWIHQTYARNLAIFGKWEFNPGDPSAGSTSPLWTAFIAAGCILKIPYLLWTFLLGGIYLFLIGVIFQKLVKSTTTAASNHFLLAFGGILIVGEWHLVWAAVSGMETLAFILVILIIFKLLIESKINWWLIGTILGISIWIRPDGLTLIGPVLFVLLFRYDNILKKLFAVLKLIPGLAIVTFAYFIFNYQLTGTVLPNTYFSKQFEYSGLLQIPVWDRLFAVFLQPFIGAGILLLPGMIYQLFSAIKAKNYWWISSILWSIGYLAMYALFLPVTYQHGRYQMPVLPIVFLISFSGVLEMLVKIPDTKVIYLLKKAWVITIMITSLAFNILGARTYGYDVAIIETEIVKTARWINTNTKSNSIIAAHDIGALGYFGNRKIIDLAGLVTPGVIPFMRDEVALRKYMYEQKVDYLMTFPTWYPELVKNGEEVFRTHSEFSPASGGDNMIVINVNSIEVK